MRLFYIALLFILSGCTAINKSSFQDLSSSYREVVEQYSNENILINIVRASKNMPMSFLDIPSVIGTGSVAANANTGTTFTSADPGSIGGFFTPSSSQWNASLGMSVNNGFTFTQASLDNSEFMGSFLKDIPLDTVIFHGTESHLPKAVIYTLLIDNIEVRTKDNQLVHTFRNDARDPQYKEFQRLLYLMIDLGLTVEKSEVKVPIGPSIPSSNLASSFAMWATTFANDKNNLMSLEQNDKSGSYQLMKKQTMTKVCINKYRSQEILGGLVSPTAFCADSIHVPPSTNNYQDIVSTFKSNWPRANELTFSIKLRSAGNVFDFLGNVLLEQYSDPSNLIKIRPSRSMIKSDGHELALLRVYKNTSIPNPAYTVSYKGATYSIADDDESYTKPVLEFMSTLITLAKIPGAIPASPAVLVR